jgi:hypothetical protein
MRARLSISLMMLTVGAGVAGAAIAQPGALHATSKVRKGGTFRVSFEAGALDSVDPALSYSLPGWALLERPARG